MRQRKWVDPKPDIALSDGRARIWELLQAADGPVGVQELAEQTGLHPNTVRFHLDKLTDAGLAERTTAERDEPGRPRKLYRPAGEQAHPGVRSYRLLADMLTSLITAMVPDPGTAALETGQAWGRHLADRPAPLRRTDADTALIRLAELLTELGFSAHIDQDRRHPQIRLLHCPFREVAQEHQGVVCSVHLGLMQGALAEMNAPLTAERLDPFVGPHLCLAHLTRQPDTGTGTGTL